MDPLSAFSIATGVVTFIDFGAKLISVYSEIQESQDNRPEAITNLQKELRDLSENATFARDRIASLQAQYPGQSLSLSRLAKECTLAEKQLQSLVESLTAKPGQGFKNSGTRAIVSIRGVFKQGVIQGLDDRLKSLREQIMMSVIMCILERVTALNSLGRDVGSTLPTLNTMKTTINNLQPEFQNISQGRRLPSMLEKEKMANGLWTSITVADQVAPKASSGGHSGECRQLDKNDEFYNKIMEELEFKDMMARERQIEDPFPETFQWLLNDESAETVQPTDFEQWLMSTANETPFWITGHPASGKSTLMKFICNNRRIQMYLDGWSDGFKLLTCRIYFWNPGSSGQKSEAGLLHTILYQLLSQRSDLCQTVASRRYLYFQLAGTNAPNPPEWTIEELRDCITKFVSETKSTDRLAMFIDGLDEYEGNGVQLLSFLRELHRDYSVKLCVSSRAWNVFKDEFRFCPRLEMELLTRPDIEKYVYTRVGNSPSFQELRALHARSVQDLECKIIERAEGIFLWVTLVVEKLIITAQDNNDLRTIWKEFESLPQGLEELYNSMRRRLDRSFLEGASIMYQLIFRWKEIQGYSITALDFWVAINCHNPVELQQYPIGEETIRVMPALERRLAGHTGGMLQVRCITNDTTDMSVEFLHRTVFDWFQGIRSVIISDGPTDYDSTIILISCLVSRLSLPPEHSPKSINTEEVFYFARACNNSVDSRGKLLRIFKSIDSRVVQNRTLSLLSHPSTFDASHLRDEEFCYYLAIRCACPPYLQAQLEDSPQNTRSGLFRRRFHYMPGFLQSQSKGEWQSLVVEAALEVKRNETLDNLNHKLMTVEVLLKTDMPLCRSLKNGIRDRIKRERWPQEYWKTLLAGVCGEGFKQLTNVPEEVIVTDVRHSYQRSHRRQSVRGRI